MGGDIDAPHESGDSVDVKFLDGELINKYSYYFTANYELLRRFYIFAGAGESNSDPGSRNPFWEVGFELNYGQK